MKQKIEIGESAQESLKIRMRIMWKQLEDTTSDHVSLKKSTSDVMHVQLLNPISVVMLLSRSADNALYGVYGLG